VGKKRKQKMEIIFDLKELDDHIQQMKSEALRLKDKGKNFPALARNMERILASIKMLELNISIILER
jgi:hypothetical protein